MATTYEELYDLFMQKITDYNLDNLYAQSESGWATYLQGFLRNAIPRFDTCNQDLTDRDNTTATFNITLTEKEKDILVKWMVAEWKLKDINDVRQINLHLSDSEFKHYSESQNLKEKIHAYNEFVSEIQSDMNRYGWDNTDWTTAGWAGGDYTGNL